MAPVAGLLAFAAVEATAQLREANEARAVEQQVRSAADVGTARAHLQAEIMPALTRSFFAAPRLQTTMSLGGLSMSQVGVSDQQIRELRAATDVALHSVASDARTASAAAQVQALLPDARADVDTPERIPAGWAQMTRAIAELDAAELAQIERAKSVGVDRSTGLALADVELVVNLVRAQDLAMPELVAANLAPPETRAAAWTTLHMVWGRILAAAEAVSADADKDVVASIDAAQKLGAGMDRAIAAYATAHEPYSLAQLARLYQIDQRRSVAMSEILARLDGHAVESAATQRTMAGRRAALIGGAVLLIVGFSVGITIAVRRAMARPLQELAEQATKVSLGELVPVRVRGPYEVRTVAHGLASAVANLRKVAAQATAVAAGDLSSEIVREPLPGALGSVVHHSVSVIIDAIHDRDAAQRDLAHRATHDALTELPNRTQAMTFVRQALHRAQRTASTTALMFVDLDNFKQVNDTLGHGAGDAVLRECSQRMTSQLRAGDTVFRLGGDEFVVLLEGLTIEADAVHLAERLIHAISVPIPVDGTVASVGASIGVAFCTDGSVDAERLLSDADAAAYRAKQSGRGRVGIFDDELRDALRRRAELETAVRHALANDELVLHYQPVVQLRTGRTTGVEALIRWNRPGHGLLLPAEFIPAAEGSTLINEVGRWVLHKATAQLAEWDAEGRVGPEVSVSVNISGRHLLSSRLVDDVRDALESAGLAPERLTVEVTETVVADDPVATSNMQQLRDLGVAIALDDFGTGYTSIGQLPKLPIDTLKIDRSFITSCDPGSRALVELIVAAAHAFKITVVAEGIELPEHAHCLTEIGVDSGQGYYFARPAPSVEFRDDESAVLCAAGEAVPEPVE